jgi:hypothetical protein
VVVAYPGWADIPALRTTIRLLTTGADAKLSLWIVNFKYAFMEKVYLLFELLNPSDGNGERDLLGLFPSVSAAREAVRDIGGGQYSRVSKPVRLLGSNPRWKLVGSANGGEIIVRTHFEIRETTVGDFVNW